MVDFWRVPVRQQFHAAIDTLENAIDACPDPVWRGEGPRAFWYLAFHTLFWLDMYLSDCNEEQFRPLPPFGLGEFEDGVLPERVYRKDELLAYLEHGRKKLDAIMAGMTDDWVADRCAVTFRTMSKGELLLYNMRHVQHHAAQLNMLLRQAEITPPDWVSTGGQKS